MEKQTLKTQLRAVVLWRHKQIKPKKNPDMFIKESPLKFVMFLCMYVGTHRVSVQYGQINWKCCPFCMRNMTLLCIIISIKITELVSDLEHLTDSLLKWVCCTLPLLIWRLQSFGNAFCGYCMVFVTDFHFTQKNMILTELINYCFLTLTVNVFLPVHLGQRGPGGSGGFPVIEKWLSAIFNHLTVLTSKHKAIKRFLFTSTCKDYQLLTPAFSQPIQ